MAVDLDPYIFYLDNTGFPYPALPYATGGGHTDEPELTMTNITAAGASWHVKDGDLVLVQNKNAGATKGVTLTAYANARGRIGSANIDYEVPISGFIILGPVAEDGWASAGVALLMPGSGDQADIFVAVIRPR